MEFTKEQLNVINAEGDLLVSASAGCGKTTVMLQRVLRLLKSGTPLSRMLITTFTNSAAADMRGKLGQLLRAEYEQTKDPFLKQQYESLPTADISTLHTWCVKLIRKYFFVTGDDPAFEIASETEASVWKREAIERAIEEYSAIPEYAEFFETYTYRRKTNKIYSVVSSLMEFAAAQADGDAWLGSAADFYESGVVREFLTGSEMDALKDVEEQFLAFEMSAKSAGVWGNAESYVQSLRARLAGADQPPLRAVGITVVKPEYDALKKAVGKIEEARAGRMEFRADEARFAASVFVAITQTASAYYAEKKEERAQLDFNDLERRAKIIMSSTSGDEVRAGYDYIFIDEYQDINPLQESIIKQLKGNAAMFFVGDIKQSIYSFRNCSPDAFDAKTKELPTGSVLLLNSNFRCSSGILKFCNNVFARIMTEKFGKVDYKARAMFACDGPANDGSVEIISLPAPEKAAEEVCLFDSVYSVRDAAQQTKDKEYSAEAAAVAAKIVELLGQTVTENGIERAAGYDDIVVIVRSRGGCVPEITDALRAIGVPVSVGRDLSLAGGKYARDLLSYLRLIDNRYNDIALVGAMRSVFGGFSDSELARLRQVSREGSFYSCVMAAAEAGDKKVRGFLATLGGFAKIAAFISPGELAGRITAHFDYFKYVMGQPGGQHAEALSVLLEKMNSFDGSLAEWLKYIDESPPEADARAAGGSVRIMTTHASKGLEFPFVVLCNLGRRFNMTDLKDGMCDSRFGLALMSRNRESRRKFPTDVLTAAKIKKDHAIKEEELRILYVAMTRAKHKLVLVLPAQSDDEDVSPQSAIRASDWLWPSAKAWGHKPPQPMPEIKPATLPKTLNPKTLEKIAENAVVLNIPERRQIKMTVTSLSGDAYSDDAPKVKPLYAADVDATDRGNAYHKILELYDYSQPTAQLDGLLEGAPPELLKERGTIERAVSAIAQLVEGKKFYREQTFIYRAPQNLTEAPGIIVQGVIDLLIVTGAECEIVDYKTGRLSEGKMAAYRKQLDIYADAVEKTLGLKVTKKTVYGIDEGKFYN